MKRARTPRLITKEEVAEIYKKEVRSAIEAGGFGEYDTPTYHAQASVKDRFLEGLYTYVRGKNPIVAIKWTSHRKINPNQFFRKGTKDHWIRPVKAKALRWFSEPKWPGDDFGAGGPQFSGGHVVKGVKAPPEDPILVGKKQAEKRVTRLVKTRKTRRANKLRKAIPKPTTGNEPPDFWSSDYFLSRFDVDPKIEAELKGLDKMNDDF